MDDQNDVASSSLNQSAAVAVTGKVMVVAIIVMFLVVVFVLFLHLYAKWFWWRIEETTVPSREARNPRRRRFVFAPSQDPARTGLDPSLLRSLPTLVFDPAEFKDGLECAVCLSEVVRGEKARLLPKCSHGFHVDCIDMWLQSHSTCPICRNPISIPTPISSSSPSSLHSVEEDPNPNSISNSSNESLNFPTNVLFWGNEVEVSSRVESQPSSSLQELGTDPRSDGMLIIDIPRQVSESLPPEDDLKSPMTTRLRSLKRLLSKEKRVFPSTSSSCVESEPLGRSQNS